VNSLPMALGIALSPVAVIPAILLLLTEQPRRTSASFVAGWLSGIVVLTTAGALLADVADAAEQTPVWATWARIIVGLVLVWLGLRLWWERAEPREQPRLTRSLRDATPRSGLRLGVLLSALNPKIALLALGGGLTIGATATEALHEAWEVVVFSLVATATVAAPLVAYLAVGERARSPLEGAGAWLERNHAVVMAVVLVAVGGYLVIGGYRSL
jgi:threonine/homoserine/homoserine lactone efflux protein